MQTVAGPYRPRLARIALVCGALAVLMVLAVSQFIAHARVDEIDVWLFAHYGRRLIDGATLYVDIWDNKPPGIFWINALGLWLGGGSIVGVWVIEGVAVASTAVLLYVTTRRMYGSLPAIACTLPAVLFLNIHTYHVGCNRPSTFFVLTELACFYFYLRGVAGGRNRFVLLWTAGACGALGLAFKQSAVAATMAVGLHTVYLGIWGDVSGREAAGRVAALVAGWLCVVVVVVAGLWLTSDPGAAYDAIVAFNRRYFLPGAGASVVPPFAWIESHLQNMGLALVLAVGALLSPLVMRGAGPDGVATGGGGLARDNAAPDAGPPEVVQPPRYAFLLGAWLVVAVYVAALGPHMRVAYLAIALPPLVLAMSHGIYLLLASGWCTCGRRRPFPVVVALVWCTYMLIWPLHAQWDMAMRQYYHRFVAPPDRLHAVRVDAIENLTDRRDSIFIFGYAPELYWQTGRSSAIRYIGTEKIAQLGPHGQPMLDDTLDRLAASPPKLIVLDGATPGESMSVGRLNTQRLAAWFTANYVMAEPKRYPNVWVRRGGR